MRFSPVTTASVLATAFVLAGIIPARGSAYSSIPERNLFGLRAAAAPSQPQMTEAPKSKIILTGITTLLGNKRAFFVVAPPQAQQAPVDASRSGGFALTEGERKGDLEVLQIDEM